MKTIITIFLLLSLSKLVLGAGIDPTFNMTAKNIFRHPGANGQDSVITFELYMQQTNQGQPGVNEFEYAAAQFTFSYNTHIQPPGKNLVFGIVPAESGLPPSLRPPTFQVDSVNGYLKASGNLPNSLANFFISGVYPGTRILTFKVRTNGTTFNPVPLNLRFKLGASPNTLLAYFLPYPDSVDSEQHPNQTAVALLDTNANHYSVEDSNGSNTIFLATPVYNSVAGNRTINFSWNSTSNAVSYKLLVSNDVNFNNIVYSDSSLTDTFKTISSLVGNTAYYWKVSGKNDSAYFAFSDVWIFNTNGISVNLVSPAEAAASVALPVTFIWNKLIQTEPLPQTGVLGIRHSDNLLFIEKLNEPEFKEYDVSSNTLYYLKVATDANFNNIIYYNSTLDTFKTLDILTQNQTYYWQVISENDSLFTADSEIRRFNTNLPPVTLISPPNNSTNINTTVNLIWRQQINAVSYKLSLSTDPDFNNIIFNDSTLTDTSQTIGNLKLSTRYYWKVFAKNDTGYIAYSGIWNFTTSEILISPANNSLNQPTTINFLWHKDNNAVNYVLQVSTDPNLNNFIINDSNLTDTFKTVSGLDSSTLYFWRIKVKYSSNNILTSNIWHFTTTSPSGLIYTLSAPLDGTQEVPPNGSVGLGQISGTYNSGTRELSFSLTFTGLTTGTVAANFHAPAFPGSVAPVVIPFSGFPTGVTSGFYQNTYVLTPAQDAQILNGLWYVNIRTIAFPGGEIRGQLDEGGSLPVELSGFTSNINRDKVTLNWSTSAEINNAGFDIERSNVNGQSSDGWIKIGFVNGNGNSNELKNYSFSERINSGKYSYRLKQIDFNGSFKYFNLTNEVEVGIPNEFTLSQNYPNPFNPTTKIDYELPIDGKINMILYDISGREVAALVNEFKSAGYYTINFNASNLASGIYFYVIRSNNFQMTRRMVVVK